MRRDDLSALREIADYMAFRKRLRNFGLVGLVIGLVCLAMGFIAVLLGWPRWLIFAAGLGFVLGASWALETPHAIRLGVLGALLVAAGLLVGWALALLPIIDATAGEAFEEPSLLAWILIVPAMFVWGRWSIAYAMEIGRKRRVKAPSPLEREVAAAVEGLQKADLEREPDIVDFIVLRSFSVQQTWRGRLMDKMAVFVEGKGNQILIADKQDVDIALVSDRPIRNNYRIRLRCEERTINNALMPTQAFEKYLSWKLDQGGEIYN